MSINILGILISFGALIIAMTAHEFAHGWMAHRRGDNTAKYSGRLTLNPLAHIDIFWTIVLPLFLYISSGGRFIFGAAKPVPINYWALRNPKRDIIWIGLSGPIANFIFAFLLAFVTRFFFLPNLLAYFTAELIHINVLLGVFNLIPIPPLDGSRAVIGLLPPEAANRYASLEPYGFVIVFVLLNLGLLNFFVYPLASLIFKMIGIIY